MMARMARLIASMLGLALLVLAIGVKGRELLEEVGPTIVPLEGKDLGQFVTVSVMEAERRVARANGIVPEFTGDGTAYSTAVPDASGFACSNREIPPKAQKMFAAINSAQWEEGAHCGRCVRVWCTDSFCQTRFRPYVLKLYDKCPECSYGDLDMSEEAYEMVTGRWPHRLQIGWEFLSREECNAAFDHGDEIRMDLKDSWNQWYRGFYFSMAADLIESIRLDGRSLTPSQFGFWEDFSGAELGDGPFTFELTSVAGETLKVTVDDVMVPTQYLGVQFTRRDGA